MFFSSEEKLRNKLHLWIDMHFNSDAFQQRRKIKNRLLILGAIL